MANSGVVVGIKLEYMIRTGSLLKSISHEQLAVIEGISYTHMRDIIVSGSSGLHHLDSAGIHFISLNYSHTLIDIFITTALILNI